MRWKVLISAPYMQLVVDRFRPTFAEHDTKIIVPPVNERLSEEELLRWVGDVDGVICGDDQFTEQVLQAAGRLKVISKWGTGIDSIDLAACERLGITVCNTPNAFSEPVADTVMGYVLCFARNLLRLDRKMREGTWHKTTSRALRECVLGVIGVGNVGRVVVRWAVAFGMRVLGNDIVEMSAEFLAETGTEMGSKEELLRRWPDWEREITKSRLHDLGKMVFAFSVFWMYLFFSQYIVIWYGNLPEETQFFQLRLGSQFLQDTWTWSWSRLDEPYVKLSLAAWIGCWIVPFWMLLANEYP